jgi:hypothetical protein
MIVTFLAVVLALLSPTASAQADCDIDCGPSPFTALRTTISDNVAAPFRNALLQKVAVAERLYRHNNVCGSVRLLTAIDDEVAGLANSSQISGEAAGLIHASISNVISSIFPPDPVIPGDACAPEGPPI